MIPAPQPSRRPERGRSNGRPFHVLYLSGSFPPRIGGLETMGAELAAGLAGRGHRVTVVTESMDPGAGPLMLDGVDIHRRDFLAALDARDVGRIATLRGELIAMAAAIEPDVVHVAFSPMTAYYALGARLHDTAPVVLTFYAWWPEIGRPGGTVTRRAVEAADWVIACSEATLGEVRASFPQVAARSSVVHNALDHPHDAPPGGQPMPPVLVAAGHLREDKGFDVLIEAFRAVHARFPGARLLLAGDGPDRVALEEAARPLGDAVQFLGWAMPETTASLLDRSAVVAVPSRVEAFGLVALEAALRARPVVASAVGGLPEVVDAPATGLLVGPDDPEALAGAICELLGDPARAARMGTAAQARARTLFTPDRFLEAHERVYERVTPHTPAEANL